MQAKDISNVLAASSSLRVIDIDPQTDPRWEAFLASVPDSLIYYHPAWLKVVEEAYSCKPRHLACEDSTGQVVGILPFFYQHGWRSGRRFTSMFNRPLTSDDLSQAALVQAAIERTRAEAGMKLRLKMLSNALDGMVDGAVARPVHETYTLSLPEKPELLHLNSSIRRAINKATRMGVQVRQAQTEGELRAWYDLYVQTIRKFIALPNPYRYYRIAWRRLHANGMLRLLLAEHIQEGQRKLLGGIVLLRYGQTVSFASAGWREEDQELRANDVLHWRAIQDACAEGFRRYDFGDVDLENQGLARFKSKWGAKPKMVYEFSYPSFPSGLARTPGLIQSSAYRLARSRWPHVPTKVIRRLSDWYYILHLY